MKYISPLLLLSLIAPASFGGDAVSGTADPLNTLRRPPRLGARPVRPAEVSALSP